MNTRLLRFIAAQENSYAAAFREMRAGKKTSHWMWYVFPQLKGLGRSAIAQQYAISSRAEAIAYLSHEILGDRLLSITSVLVNDIDGLSAQEIFGYPDWLKFHSSMTLFHLVVQDMPDLFADEKFAVFCRALEKYYHAEPDEATVQLWTDASVDGEF